MLTRHSSQTLPATQNLSRFGRWARSQGATVVQVEKLSFQDELQQRLKGRAVRHIGAEDLAGPYLRLAVPSAARAHSLFRRPCVCPDFALYIDTDVLFWNVTAAAIARELQRLGPDRSRSPSSCSRPAAARTPDTLQISP